jgi:hypothetical protein
MTSDINALHEYIKKLEAENAMLKIHAPYGILTRAAFEMEKRKFTDGQFVIFGDIDDMHGLNTQYGYEAVNAKIREALQVRAVDLLMTGLWFSGDEIVFIVSGDPVGFCERIKQSFHAHAMSITLAFAKIENGNVDVAINQAAQTVQTTKRARK